MTTGENKKGIMDILIAGIPLPIYIGLLVIVFGLMLAGKLPKGMIGAFAVMMAFGGIFNVIGNKTPIVKTYLGGGAIVCIFASAALVYFKVIPEEDFLKLEDGHIIPGMEDICGGTYVIASCFTFGGYHLNTHKVYYHLIDVGCYYPEDAFVPVPTIREFSEDEFASILGFDN